MGDSHSIIDLGKLSKPANTLIEKISDAIGGIAKPWQIKRVAQAEAEAEKIRTIGEIEVSDLQRRAVRRFLMEEAKKQHNIESITSKALPEISPDAAPENVEDDWIANFFDKCRLISDEEMQQLWSKILAGEANSPGKFSKRTVNLLAGLDKSEAELFSNVCRFCVSLGEPTALIYGPTDKIYSDNGVNFRILTHLDSIGLLRLDPSGFRRKGLGSKGIVRYFDEELWIEFPNSNDCTLSLGKVMLTQPGQQLAEFAGAEPVDGFADYIRDQWKRLGYATVAPAAGSEDQGNDTETV